MNSRLVRTAGRFPKFSGRAAAKRMARRYANGVGQGGELVAVDAKQLHEVGNLGKPIDGLGTRSCVVILSQAAILEPKMATDDDDDDDDVDDVDDD